MQIPYAAKPQSPNLKTPITWSMLHLMAFGLAMTMLSDLNGERASRGLQPLAIDARLTSAATGHAADMAQHGYFAHESQSGQSPFDRIRAAGCSFDYAGENIAMAPDVQSADSALFQSPPHRENILSADYHRVGIGVARDTDGDLYFVEDFSN